MAKILVIDDEKDFLKLVRDKLVLDGYDVETAADGKEGLDKARSGEHDLILCDIRMPLKDGLEVVKELRSDASFSTPIIMLTAVDEFEKVREAYSMEANFYVTKPVKFKELLKNIRVLLSLSGNRAE